MHKDYRVLHSFWIYIMNNKIIKQGLDEIATRDSDVATALLQLGYPEPRIRPPGFETFFSIVVGQQLSTHAAAAIMLRARELLPELTAEKVLAVTDEQLRSIGLSKQKTTYIQGMAEAIAQGEFTPESLETMDDEEAIKAIVALKGFGPWSAEIYLMFSLQRTDIFPSGDLALLVALQKLKGLDEKPTPAEAKKIIEHWSPWRSIGSLFLWHYYHGAPT
ncbi:DNA-3-methyladenine glycosylase [Cocleimonas flava]